MNRDRKGKITTVSSLCEKVFQALTRTGKEGIPTGVHYCPLSTTLRCISNLVTNTNQEVISARGATCHTLACIGRNTMVKSKGDNTAACAQRD